MSQRDPQRTGTVAVAVACEAARWAGWLRALLVVLVVGGYGGSGSSARAQERSRLVTEHADLKVMYDPARGELLEMVVRDEDRAVNHAASGVILEVGEPGRIDLPPGTPFGGEGGALWVLPQSQDTRLLYLGVSAEGLPRVFEGALEVRLVRVVGPGGFYAWQADAFGGLDIRMNSVDGVTVDDRTTPIVGSHEHFNWGFTAPGEYRVTLQVVARKTGQAEPIRSPETTFVFQVLPLPTPAGFRAWQGELLVGRVPAGMEAPGGDPDGDGLVNLAEYALGGNPTVAEAGKGAAVVWEPGVGGGAPRFGLRFTLAPGREDVVWGVEESGMVGVGSVWSPAQGGVERLTTAAGEQVTVWAGSAGADAVPGSGLTARRFLRFHVSLNE